MLDAREVTCLDAKSFSLNSFFAEQHQQRECLCGICLEFESGLGEDMMGSIPL
jgi:hypothetical protein